MSPTFAPLRADKHPREYQEAWEIWDNGKRVMPWDYFNKIKGVNVKSYKQGTWCLEIKKQKKCDFGLKLICAIDTNEIWKDWMGVKSIYTTQHSFIHHWKRLE